MTLGRPPHDRMDPRRRTLVRAGAALAATGPVVLAGLSIPMLADAQDRTVVWPGIDLLGAGRLEPADWTDTAAVLVFWATWCAFCTRHNAHVERLHRAMAGRRLRVLGVCMDGDDPARVQAHARRHGWTFPISLDGATLRSQFTTRRVVPMTVGIDRQGRWRTPIPGEMSEGDVLEFGRLARES